MKKLILFILMPLLAILAGCSSNGGDAAATVSVTPVGGKFTYGFVDAFNSSGAKIGSGTVNSATGAATVTLNSATTPSILVFRVTSGVFYDEGTNSTVTMGLNDSILGVVSSAASGGSYAVTPLTDMAAAIAGISFSSTTASSFTPPAGLSVATINTAISTVPLLLGVDPSQLDITKPPTLISSASTEWPSALGSVATAKANAQAYLLAILSANARAGGLTNMQLVSALRTSASNYYSGAAFVMPNGLMGGDGKLATANLAAYNSAMVTALQLVSAQAIGSNTIVPFTDKTSIALALSNGLSFASLSVTPGAYCPAYQGRQILDPTDPKNAPYFATATGYMTSPGFSVTDFRGASPSFTIFNGAPSALGESGASGVYLEYYTVYGLPSWFSGGNTGGIFTGTYSGTSGGTDGYALNTLMMSNGYTGSGTFMLTYSGMTTPTPYFLSTTGGSTGGLRQVVLTCPI